MENKNNEVNNNEFNDNEKKVVDKNKMAKVLSAIAFLAILFCGTYFITDYIIISKDKKNQGEEDSVVLNQNLQALEDDTVVVLKTKNIIDSEKKLSELKDDLELTGRVTKESLVKALENNLYKIDKIDGDKLVFNRNVEHILIPNKFYLGEKDGLLAIYETNKFGTAKDIYIDKTPIDALMEEQQEVLRTFKKYYDTEENARIQLTAYSS